MKETNVATKAGDDTDRAAKGLPWYAWDIVLLGFLFLFGTLGNSFPLLFYWGGLHCDKDLVFAAVMWFAVLVPGAGICLLIEVMRITRRWPWHIAGRRRLLVLQLIAITVTLAYVALPFMSIGPPSYKMHMWGLRKYAKTKVDVSAIRTWLGSLDPNESDGVEIDIRRNAEGEPSPEPNDPVLPPCVLNLQPRYVTLSSLENEGLAVGLEWGSGLLGAWGITVGPETMGTPPAELSRCPDYSLDVSPGVRIWHNIE